MRADLGALIGIEKALEQRAEDGRVDLAPVEARRGLQQADLVRLQFQRAAAVEQAAVEMRDHRHVEDIADFHGGKQAVEKALGKVRPFAADFQYFWKKPVRQQFYAVGKEAEYQLIDEMRDIFRRVAALQAERDGGKFVGRFSGDGGAGFLRLELVRVEEHRAQNIEPARIGEIVERQLVGFWNRVGPGGADQEPIGIAGDLQRRVFQRRRVADQLRERVVEVALLLLVLPREETLLPDISKTLAAAGLGHALLERERGAGRIGRHRIVVPQQGA